MLDFIKLQKETEAAVLEASDLMMGSFTTEQKGSVEDIVTSADLAVQKFLEQRLTAVLPEAGFFGEEGCGECKSEYLWVVDPIDGTTNFSRGIRDCAISVALVHKGEPVLGVVYGPYQNRLYSAVKDQGATCNAEPIHVSGKAFKEGLFCTALSLYRKEYAERCMDVLRDVYSQCNDFRRFGSCALELCYLAEGKCELYFEYRVFPWDCAAAALILQEAGGFICNGTGEPLPFDRATPVIAANSKENLDTLVQIVKYRIPNFDYEEILMDAQEKDTGEFHYTPLTSEQKKPYLDLNLAELYEKALEELSLQQTKRDQIITLYLAMFSFLIPFALSQESLTWLVKGSIFLITGVVGILFALIIVRYRIYKEAYWLCCQCITVLTGIKKEAMNKAIVQNAYYETMEKKGRSFYKDGTSEFSKAKYVRKNLFSSETLHFIIHTTITVIILGLGTYLVLDVQKWIRFAAAIAVAVAVFLLLLRKYFVECIKIYQVLIDKKDASFNHTFKIAWFLHFYA